MSQELREICGLWRRATFGARPDDLRRSLRRGYDATVRSLVDAASEPSDLPAPPAFVTVIPPGAKPGLFQIASVIRWWLDGMAATRQPLREKLVLFWHGHFTMSADPVFSSELLLRNNQALRQHATGRFEDLLRAVMADAAMQVFLDGVHNQAAHPNENLARELLELFTLGHGHYDEHDVRAAARALSGYRMDFPSGTLRFDEARHDDGPKRFLGHSGNLDADAVVRILAEHPQTARHVTSRLYRFFTDEAPPRAEADRLAAAFRRHHGTMLPVVDTLLDGAAFRESVRRRAAWRSPVELMVGALRAVDRGVPDLSWLQDLHEMGQLPFLPPSVKGWDGGASWINTATLLRRCDFAERAAALWTAPDAPLPDGSSAAEHVLWMLGVPDAEDATRAALARAWDAAAPHERWQRILALALASPDYQVR